MPQLNDDQTRELNRDNKLIQFLDISANNAIWDTYTPFKNKVIALKANVAAINLLAPTKEQTGTGITLSKEELKANFALLVGEMFEKTKEYAIEEGDNDLEAKVNHTTSDIFHLKDSEILPFATNLSTNIYTATLMADVTFLTYEVTATNVSDAVTLATNFNSKIGVAQSVEVTSDTANSDINDLITKVRENVASILRLNNHFRTSNNTLFKGVAAASKRDDIGVHHTGAKCTVTIAGVGAPGAIITIGDKKVTSDIIGHCPPMYVTQGNKEITCELAGQTTKHLIHHFIQGHMDNINFNF